MGGRCRLPFYFKLLLHLSQTRHRSSLSHASVDACPGPDSKATTMTTRQLLAQAESLKSTDWKKSEVLYKQILQDTGQSLLPLAFHLIQTFFIVAFTSEDASRDAEQSQGLRDQETALVKLGELYRDQKFVSAFST